MKYMNCRDVRRDIDRAGTNDFLSPAAHAHLEICSSCASLSRQQSNLHSILSSLPAVETPNDFGFRVQARLAAQRRGAQTSTFGGFSFGLRVAAAAMVLVAAAAVSLFVTLKSGGNNVHVASNPATPATVSKSSEVNAPQPISGNVAVATAPTAEDLVNSNAGGRAPKRRDVRSEVASYRGNRVSTRDTSTIPAAVVKRLDQAETYPSGPFPINASYQSLKVSVDNGRGSKRTISLPTVSFGSERTLSQNATPLMASARGVW